MTPITRLVLSALLLGACLTDIAQARSPKLYYEETKHVRVIFYDPAHEYLVKHLIRCLEAAFEGEQALFHYDPWQKVTVLLEDFSDVGHGSAGTVPKNFITMSLEPVNYTFETLPANERIQWIVS